MVDNEFYSKINFSQKSSELSPATFFRYKQFFRYIIGKDKPLVVLDIGCNTGRGGAVLKKLNPNFFLIGVDCVEERLAIASQIYDKVINCNAVSLPIENGFVDCVLAGEFVEHLTKTDALKAIREWYRVLKSGGQIILTTPNPNYFKLKLTGKSLLGGAHLAQYNPLELKNIVENLGFSLLKIKGSGRVAKYIGDSFPFLWLYGSFLISAVK